MTVREGVAVSPQVRDHLGPSLEQVLASLWPGDCQTCNQPMPGRRPALSIDEISDFAMATLHHDNCRPSDWNTDRPIPIGTAAMVTNHTWCALVPVVTGDDGQEQIKPYVLINPTLELIYLTRSPLGQWRVEPHFALEGTGFAPPPFTSTTPAAGATATLQATELTISLAGGALGPFAVTLSDRARELVEADRGATVVITHAIDPHELTDPVQLGPVLRGDRTVMAYVRIDRAGLQ
ncbi:hypothetical protein ACIA49_38870 [Kribbella sp. NPDC051587]|uniref:hypothetical protein n=1 Tax=Kribbella sp. NPDC051587 TaxID=3364119 RepID=UPI0037AFA43F